MRKEREAWRSQRRWRTNPEAEARRQWSEARSKWRRDMSDARRDNYQRYRPPYGDGYDYGYRPY